MAVHVRNGGLRVSRQLPSHPSSAGQARRMVRQLLTEHGREDLVEPAQLLMSEVVTNALVHSPNPIDVAIQATETGVLVEVADGSRNVPQPRHYAPTASTGRGLALLEHTANAWGVVPGLRGKTVWFELSSSDSGAESAPPTVDAVEGPGATVLAFPTRGDDVAVELLNVPLLLHAAWQQYAEGVLREYMLASIDVEEEAPLTQHAAASDALALAAEQIPAPDIGLEPDQLMADAVDPAMSGQRIELAVPRTSVPNFAVLDQTLDAATEMAGRGRLLVPAAQPEMQTLGHWLCEQVTTQATQAEPVPWPPLHRSRPAPQPPRHPALQWDSAPVTEADTAMIAGDDTGRILAVSAGALRLLGYRIADDLVGQRLVTVIPGRYRQAHIAGFSMYLLNGRAPLLDRPVQVPVLRQDGTECPVDLTVVPHPQPNGRALFIAELREVAATQD
jgi:PAS domain S-box-containing protein